MNNGTNIHILMPGFSGRHYSWTPEGDHAIIGKRICITLTPDGIDVWIANWKSWLSDDKYAEPLSPSVISFYANNFLKDAHLTILDGEAYATLPIDRLDDLVAWLSSNKSNLGISLKKTLSDKQLAVLSTGRAKLRLG